MKGTHIYLLLLVALALALSTRLMLGEGSIPAKITLEKRIARQISENEQLKRKNQQLQLEVEASKKPEALEALARRQLGYIKDGESFYLVILKDQENNENKKNLKDMTTVK